MKRKALELFSINVDYNDITFHRFFYIKENHLEHYYCISSNNMNYYKLERMLLISGLDYEKKQGVITIHIKTLKEFDMYMNILLLIRNETVTYNREEIEEFFK